MFSLNILYAIAALTVNFVGFVPTLLSLFTCDVQAKLNCEVLWDDLALEVRWAVAGETIVLQLVGKIGTTTPYDKFTETLKLKQTNL